MKILLVEDERQLSDIIAKGLRKSGYAVDTVYDGEVAIEFLEINEYDLVILDLNIPKIDGIDVLGKIRKINNEIKVLILSARSKIYDKVLGLDAGANDYMIKPFDFIELEARIRNLIRRSFTQQPTIIECRGMQINASNKLVTLNDTVINLTKKEYSILEYLMLNKNKVISAEMLIEHVWDSDVDLFSNSLKYHIHSLKKKISNVSNDIEIIKNIRNQGYIMEDDLNDK